MSVVFTTWVNIMSLRGGDLSPTKQSKRKEEMQNYYNQIKNSPVFFGISEEELKEMLECFNARIKTYDDSELIIRQGDMINNIYLVLEKSE